MENNEQNKTIDPVSVMKRAIRVYGADNQIDKALEECGELITAISRCRTHRADETDIITEVADVWIMVTQLSFIYGTKAVNDEIDRKLRRLEARMDYLEDGGAKVSE